jgi:acyl dehydratase
MEPTTITTVSQLKALVGQDLGASAWFEITQDRVDAFADATGDHQYIHVDPERARATLFGGTVAHGYLTLSLLPALSSKREGAKIDLGARMAVNYGLNRVRFPAPVPVGKRIRAHTRLLNVDEPDQGIVQLIFETTIEVESTPKPAMVAETITRYYL